MTITATEKLSALRQAAADARQAAAALRDRVRAGEGLVTGRQLAEADANVEVADLRAEAGEIAAIAEQEAERIRSGHEAADRYLREEPPARQAFLDAIAGLGSALDRVRQAAAAHQDLTGAARRAVLAVGDTDRIRANRAIGGGTIDGQRIQDITAAEWLRHVVGHAERALIVPFEDRQLWPPASDTVGDPEGRTRPNLPAQRPAITAEEAHREEQEHLRRWNQERAAGNNVHVDQLAVRGRPIN